MTDEIKEILKDLGDKDNYIEEFAYQYKRISLYDSFQLLDYITNLQHNLEVSQTNEETYRLEMQEITKIFGLDEHTLFDDVKEYATNLQQENKEYSMIFDTFSKRPYAHKYLEEKKKELNNNKIIGLDSEMVYKDYYDYKSRCEKAIEILEQDKASASFNTAERIALNILNGSDENEY